MSAWSLVVTHVYRNVLSINKFIFSHPTKLHISRRQTNGMSVVYNHRMMKLGRETLDVSGTLRKKVRNTYKISAGNILEHVAFL